jgi:hypothetical protein
LPFHGKPMPSPSHWTKHDWGRTLDIPVTKLGDAGQSLGCWAVGIGHMAGAFPPSGRFLAGKNIYKWWIF